MFFTAYIDESCSHDNSPVLVLGAYIAPTRVWRRMEPQWAGLLSRPEYSLTYFHSKRLRHGQKEFKGWHDTKKIIFVQEIEALLSGIQSKHHFGIVSVLRRDDYEAHYLEGSRASGRLDSMYGLSFRFIMLEMLSLMTPLKQKVGTVRINPIAEAGHRNVGDAGRIFRELRSCLPSREAKMLGNAMKPADKKSCCGVQVADAVAYMSGLAEVRTATWGTAPDVEKVRGIHTGGRRRLEITPAMMKAARDAAVNRRQGQQPYCGARMLAAGT